MSTDKNSKKEGSVILENYRKQLHDKMKREKNEREEMEKQGIDPRASQIDLMEFMDKRIASFEQSSVPDPKELEDIIDDLRTNSIANHMQDSSLYKRSYDRGLRHWDELVSLIIAICLN